jgi:ribosomal protein S18 acetylase RimI-like enzyme
LQTIVNDFEANIVDRLVDVNQNIVFGKFIGDKSLPIETLTDVFKKRIKEKIVKGEAHRYALLSKDEREATGLVAVENSDWDTQHFGVGIGRFAVCLFDSEVSLEQRASLLHEAAGDCKLAMISARIGVQDIRTIQALESEGAVLTDVLLTFRSDVSSTRLIPVSPKVDISRAREEDAKELSRMGHNLFSIDRFHCDPRLPKSKSDELYQKWVLNSLHNMADAVLVARKEDRVLGFITCKIEHLSKDCRYGLINLIGVDSTYQRQGIGSMLLCSAFMWFADRVDSVYVGTQAANFGAVRLYEKCGFQHVFSEATLHLWSREFLTG